MDNNQLIIKINEIAVQKGAIDIGFCDISDLPQTVNHGFNQAISIVVPLAKGVLQEIVDKPTITYFSHYRAINRLIDDITLSIGLTLERAGYISYPIPASQSDPAQSQQYAAVFSHKMAAVLSGLGWIGKSALFLHADYGPGIRLGTVLCNTQFAITNRTMESQCGSCTICRDQCPAGAIEGTLWKIGMDRRDLFDARCCSTFMKNNYQRIGRGSVCGLCMVKCPYVQNKIKKGGIDESI